MMRSWLGLMRWLTEFLIPNYNFNPTAGDNERLKDRFVYS